MKKTVVVDCRMITHSGIGVYIRNIIPRLLASGSFSVKLIGDSNKLSSLAPKEQILHTKVTPFSPLEQIALPSIIPKCNIFWTPHFDVPILPIRAKYRAVTIHDMYQFENLGSFPMHKQLFVRMAYRAIKKKYSLIFADSQFTKKRLQHFVQISAQRVEIVYCGVNDELVEVKPKEKKEKYILYVGNFKKHKNIDRLIDAFKSLSKGLDGYTLKLVGKIEGFASDGVELSEKLRGWEDKIEVTGRVNNDKLSSLYAHASLFVFPSLYEGFGLPVLEAMRYGIPIVSSNAASLPEVGGNVVHYCDPYSTDSITEAIINVLNNNEKVDRDLYAENLKKFSWDKSYQVIENKFLQLFEDN